jgi:SAM-dependent methyltransferase
MAPHVPWKQPSFTSSELETKTGRTPRAPDPTPLRTLHDLEHHFGIRYLAPRDARATGLPSSSVDFASSAATLEHIPAIDLVPLLAECRRLLRPDGAMSSRIDLRDHYAHFDPTISPYNFLRFGMRTWRILNPPLHHQNRLRRPDYLEAFATAGFHIVEERVTEQSERDLAALRQSVSHQHSRAIR